MISKRLAKPSKLLSFLSLSLSHSPTDLPFLLHSRVYFSTPPNAKATEDYLVDHSIFFYLMDPKGKFVDAFGRSMGAREVESKVKGYLEEWKEGGEKGAWSD